MDDLLNQEPQDIPEENTQEDAEVQEDYVVSEEQRIDERQAPPQEVEEDWKHKYEVLKGKYDSEVPRLYKEMKRLRREKQELATRLELLEKMIYQQQASSAPQIKEEEEEDEEVKKLKEEYPEIYKAVEKILVKKMGKVENKIEDVSSRMTQQQFLAQLTAMVPEWQTLNTDPDFLDWLQETDASTGYTRHQLMLFAYNQKDVNGVARWFKKYLEEQAKGGNKMPDYQEPSAPPQATRNVSPPHKKVTKTTNMPQKVYKESEIKKFYTDVALGRIPPDVRKRMEEEYTKAILEGRVILGK